jgi:hypothetical protein
VEGTGKWASVWQRFKEAPKLYPGVAKLLRELPGQLRLGFDPERSPRNNDEAEQKLRKDLEAVAQLPHAAALAKVLALESEHGRRRDWVWAQLGESPLAVALEPLARVAAAASTTLGGATIDAAISGYAADGWRCDRAALEAMSSVKAPANITLVGNAVRALYAALARRFRAPLPGLVQGAESSARAMVTGAEHEKDSCLLFADGLRYDVAGMLRDRLEAKGLRTRLGHRMAPLPTVTATAKPFSTIAHDALDGGEDAVDFNPRMRSTGQPATRSDCATTWRDAGSIFSAKRSGRRSRARREVGWRLAASTSWAQAGLPPRHASGNRARDAGRSDHRAARAGWTRIRVVTDHGWLLVPGGLPHIALPSHLAATKWSRCATVKGDAKPNVPIHSWHWNVHVRIASPPGAGSFAANTEYSHGGMSPQECIVPELIVERGGGHRRARRSRRSRGAGCAAGWRHDQRPVRARRPASQLEAGDDEHRGVGQGGRARRRSEPRCCR